MIGVMELLTDVAERRPPLAFVDGERRARSRAAIERGLSCILETQIIEAGRPTVWCAQHDERSLLPAPARSYELRLEERLRERGHRALSDDARPAQPGGGPRGGGGRRLVSSGSSCAASASWTATATGWSSADASAPPLWARFYELETDRPFFCGRDGVVKYTLAEIEQERRVGYAWYVETPRRLLERYPRWRARWTPDRDVLRAAAP